VICCVKEGTLNSAVYVDLFFNPVGNLKNSSGKVATMV